MWWGRSRQDLLWWGKGGALFVWLDRRLISSIPVWRLSETFCLKTLISHLLNKEPMVGFTKKRVDLFSEFHSLFKSNMYICNCFLDIMLKEYHFGVVYDKLKIHKECLSFNDRSILIVLIQHCISIMSRCILGHMAN